jgi:hypothetical protein
MIDKSKENGPFLWIILLILFGICADLNGVTGAKSGVPFITNFSQRDYQAAPQNWSIVQDSRGESI